MADAQIEHQEGKYTVAQVGPTKPWDFTSNGNTIQMMTYSIQISGIADWIDYAVKADADAPKPGDEIEGHIERDPKFGLRFKKKKNSNWSGGGGKYSAGAAWANAVQTAATVMGEYMKINPEAAKGVTSLDVYLARLEQVAPQVKAMVDRLAGNDKPSDDSKSESESGVSQGTAPAPTQPIQAGAPVDTGVNDSGLGDW